MVADGDETGLLAAAAATAVAKRKESFASAPRSSWPNPNPHTPDAPNGRTPRFVRRVKLDG
jgi:hypothetical protein